MGDDDANGDIADHDHSNNDVKAKDDEVEQASSKPFDNGYLCENVRRYYQPNASLPHRLGYSASSRFGDEHGKQKKIPHEVFVRASKIGRNKPCPCGSKKKYKNCCSGKTDWLNLMREPF